MTAKRVAILDDEADIRTLVSMALTAAGFTVSEWSNGLALIEELRNGDGDVNPDQASLGVTTIEASNVPPEVLDQFGITRPEGLIVDTVAPDSGAEDAGLQRGDGGIGLFQRIHASGGEHPHQHEVTGPWPWIVLDPAQHATARDPATGIAVAHARQPVRPDFASHGSAGHGQGLVGNGFGVTGKHDGPLHDCAVHVARSFLSMPSFIVQQRNTVQHNAMNARFRPTSGGASGATVNLVGVARICAGQCRHGVRAARGASAVAGRCRWRARSAPG